MNIPQEAGGKGLFAVWGSAADAVFIGGEGLILQGNAQGWTAMTLPADVAAGEFFGVWGTGKQDVYAVGYVADSTYYPVILHYDGSAWTEMDLPAYCLGVVLYEVWGTAKNKIWAVGDGMVAYDGQDWNCVSPVNEFSGGRGIWGSSADDLYIVGEDSSYHQGFIYQLKSGTDWSEVDVDFGSEPGYLEAVRDIWGGGSNHIFAVGKSSGGISVYQYDGQKWAHASAPSGLSDARLNGIWGVGTQQAWAVGDDGVILKWCK